MKPPLVYAVFENTHATLKAEKTLKQAGLVIRTAMKPKGVGPGCQMALTMPEVSAGLAEKVCRENGMRAPLFFKGSEGGEWIPVNTGEER